MKLQSPCGLLISRITSNQFRRNSLAPPRPGPHFSLRAVNMLCDDGQSGLPQNFADMSRREARSHESRREPPVAREFLEVAWHQPSNPAQLPSRKAASLTDLLQNLHLRLRNADLPPKRWFFVLPGAKSRTTR